ncbi:hypothetical protein ACN20G_23445 [Streptomyces sp. BI20]|uniref:hypothetical protein n=1 Tax=Streptomyces sp. BI20 TaxID=3403460 RepID=UPI003C7160E5
MSNHAKNKPAAKAAKNEALEKPNTFEFRGVEYTVPGALDMPIELLEVEDEIQAIKIMVGVEQWEAFKKSGATIRDFSEFADKVTEASGQGDAGN